MMRKRLKNYPFCAGLILINKILYLDENKQCQSDAYSLVRDSAQLHRAAFYEFVKLFDFLLWCLLYKCESRNAIQARVEWSSECREGRGTPRRSALIRTGNLRGHYFSFWLVSKKSSNGKCVNFL